MSLLITDEAGPRRCRELRLTSCRCEPFGRCDECWRFCDTAADTMQLLAISVIQKQPTMEWITALCCLQCSHMQCGLQHNQPKATDMPSNQYRSQQILILIQSQYQVYFYETVHNFQAGCIFNNSSLNSNTDILSFLFLWEITNKCKYMMWQFCPITYTCTTIRVRCRHLSSNCFHYITSLLTFLSCFLALLSMFNARAVKCHFGHYNLLYSTLIFFFPVLNIK